MKAHNYYDDYDSIGGKLDNAKWYSSASYTYKHTNPIKNNHIKKHNHFFMKMFFIFSLIIMLIGVSPAQPKLWSLKSQTKFKRRVEELSDKKFSIKPTGKYLLWNP